FSMSFVGPTLSILPSRMSIQPSRIIPSADNSVSTRGRLGPLSVTSCEAFRTASEVIVRYRGHPERSQAESKDPAALARGVAAGFLDFARNDMCRAVSRVQR